MLKEAIFIVLFSFLLIFVTLLPSITFYGNLQTSKQQKEYYGYSTFGFCNSNSDCIVSGCNSEICQSKYEREIFSVCIVPNEPTPIQLGFSCECVTNKCEWAKV